MTVAPDPTPTGTRFGADAWNGSSGITVAEMNGSTHREPLPWSSPQREEDSRLLERVSCRHQRLCLSEDLEKAERCTGEVVHDASGKTLRVLAALEEDDRVHL